jgi:transcriptional regulator with PAS, ATPase and Fis domain
MQDLAERVRRVAPTETTVLVMGETGVGKELVSRAIHDLSPRKGGPLTAVNCAALAEGILESELFGHVRGAFTGATRDRAGVFEATEGGTLFLDEIGEMGLALQQRLLRALQEREVTRVGATKATSVDVRVVAATNRNLRAMVAAGRFREDLYYRLAVFPIDIPPLRQRKGDIPLLVDAALARLAPRIGATKPLSCSPLAMRVLRHYDWPGNVRELFSALERAAIDARGERIEAQHLPEEVRESSDRASETRYRAELVDDERTAIERAVQESHGVLSHAADRLGMGRTTLWRKMRQYGIGGATDPRPEGSD